MRAWCVWASLSALIAAAYCTHVRAMPAADVSGLAAAVPVPAPVPAASDVSDADAVATDTDLDVELADDVPADTEMVDALVETAAETETAAEHDASTATSEADEQEMDEGTETEFGVGIDEASDDEQEDDEQDRDEDRDDDEQDLSFVEVNRSEFDPFQAAANVMPYNMAVDQGHNFMNPYLRGFNPHSDGFTPQPGGHSWNNPNGPYWSPFHWSAPASYWSVYPPQYASHYVEPGWYGRPFDHEHSHGHGYSSFPHAPYRHPHGERDPHVYGPHLDWPFGQAIQDINHLPGIGTGINEKAPFPQFRQVFEDSTEDADEAAGEATAATDELQYEVDATNRVIPLSQACVNCNFRD